MNGYALQQCLREARKAKEAAEAAADAEGGTLGSGGGGADSVREERLKYRQFEQPGTLVTLPSGGCREGWGGGRAAGGQADMFCW